MSRLHAILFWVAAAVLAAAHVIVAWNSLTQNRLWEDEAFNLSVPRNLLAGLGYTSDGAISGSTLEPWDPRISTGPTVLLPIAAVMALGADPVIGGRAVVLVFWAALLAGLFVLGSRIGGRWGGLAAVTATLAFDTVHNYSPIQGPADIVGEIPAAALLVWALIALRTRPWLAGLLVGLAVQTKLISALALPAFAVWLLLTETGSFGARFAAAWRRAWPALIGLAAPTALYFLAVLIDRGFAGLRDTLIKLARFLRDGGPAGQHTTFGEKITTLLGAWWIPVGLAAAAAVLIGALAVIAVLATRGRFDSPLAHHADERAETERWAYVVAAAAGLAAFLLWWASASHLPLWVRHPAPGIFAFGSLLAAAAVHGVRVLRHRERRLRRAAAAVAGAALVLALAAPAALHTVYAAPASGALAAQRVHAAGFADAIADNDVELPGGYLAATPWGAAVATVFLTGAHIGIGGDAAMEGVPQLSYQGCEPFLHEDAGLRLCVP